MPGTRKPSRVAWPHETLLHLRRADALARQTRTLLREAGAFRSYEKALLRFEPRPLL